MDYSNPNYFPKDPLINTALGENPVFASADNAPGTFGTEYGDNYKKYDDSMCQCRKFLNARGMPYLVV
ncbi:MAG: hypothetical protein MJ252_19695 [archaeon]|nr:hypothetical protein [archaeon]